MLLLFTLANVDPAWLALIGTLFGGIGLKAVEHYFGRSKVKRDDATRIRDELRTEVTEKTKELKAIEQEVDKWREDYYDLRDKYSQLHTELTILRANNP